MSIEAWLLIAILVVLLYGVGRVSTAAYAATDIQERLRRLHPFNGDERQMNREDAALEENRDPAESG